MKKTLKKMIAVLLLAGTMMSMLCFNAMAAYYGISGSCKGSTTFDVTTKGGIGQSIKIKPTKAGQLWIAPKSMYYKAFWANLRMVSVGPVSDNGGMMIFTREPSARRASTRGDASSTRRPSGASIRSIIFIRWASS